MANGKKSFIAYVDWKHTFDALPDDKAGKLIKHIFSYVSDEDPKSDDILINAVFANIKTTLKRDLIKWDKYIEKQRVNGKKGGRPKNPKNPSLILETQANPSKPKKADSVSVSVSVNDNVENTNNSIVQSEVLIWPTFDDFYNLYDKKKNRGTTEKKWNRLSQAIKEQIMHYLPAYIESTPDKQYRKDPTTFINQKAWEDEITKRSNSQEESRSNEASKRRIAKIASRYLNT